MIKVKLYTFLLFISSLVFSQPEVIFENNFGYEDSTTYSSGFIEVGNQLISIEDTYGPNFHQIDLRIINKQDGAEIYSLNLSNSYNESFTITPAVFSDQYSGAFFTIVNQNWNDETGEASYTTHLYNYEYSNGLNLLNSYENTRTAKLHFDDGNLFLIDLVSHSINAIDTTNYGITENILLDLDNTDFTSSTFFELENNNFLLKGNLSSGSSNNDVYLAKIDLTGQVYWERTVGGNSNDYIYQVKSINNDIYLCGKSLSYDGIFAGHYGSGVEWGDEPLKTNWALKLDFNGNIVWNKLFAPSCDSYFNGEFRDINHIGEFIILSGHKYNQYDFNPPFESQCNKDVFAVKIDLDGNIIWSNSYGGFNDQTLISAGISNNQIIYVTNLSRYSFAGWDQFFPCQGQVTAEQNGKFDYLTWPTNQKDIWVFATDFNGDILWNQFYGGENWDLANYTIYDDDIIYINSSTQSTGFDVGELIGVEDSWIFSLGVSRLSTDSFDTNSWLVCPNPSSNQITIKGFEKKGDIEFFNSLGQLVLTSKFNAVDVSSLSNGVYLIKISDGVNFSTKKFIKK